MPAPTVMLACPRCGYDVSGAVPTWTEQCPLEGMCSECGLGLAWVDIFRPERLYPAWSFEHVPRRRARALLKTVVIALRPRKLWSEMSMTAPIRGWRLLLLVLSLFVLTHVAIALTANWLLWDQMRVTAWKLTPGRLPARALAVQIDWSRVGQTLAWPYSHRWGRMVDGPTSFLLVWGILLPLPFLILAQTMRRAKCRRIHLARGAAYFVPVLACIILTDGILMRVLEALLGSLVPSWVIFLWMWIPWAFLLVLAVGFRAWWLAFTRDYLQLPQAKLISNVMLWLSFLCAFTVSLIFDDDFGGAMGRWLLSIFG